MKTHHTSSIVSSKTQSNLHYQTQNNVLTIFYLEILRSYTNALFA